LLSIDKDSAQEYASTVFGLWEIKKLKNDSNSGAQTHQWEEYTNSSIWAHAAHSNLILYHHYAIHRFIFLFLSFFSLYFVLLISKLTIYLFEQPSDGKELEFDFTLDDLETIKVIGKGSGGVVQLVRHKWVGRLFALKVVMGIFFNTSYA